MTATTCIEHALCRAAQRAIEGGARQAQIQIRENRSREHVTLEWTDDGTPPASAADDAARDAAQWARERASASEWMEYEGEQWTLEVRVQARTRAGRTWARRWTSRPEQGAGEACRATGRAPAQAGTHMQIRAEAALGEDTIAHNAHALSEGWPFETEIETSRGAWQALESSTPAQILARGGCEGARLEVVEQARCEHIGRARTLWMAGWPLDVGLAQAQDVQGTQAWYVRGDARGALLAALGCERTREEAHAALAPVVAEARRLLYHTLSRPGATRGYTLSERTVDDARKAGWTLERGPLRLPRWQPAGSMEWPQAQAEVVDEARAVLVEDRRWEEGDLAELAHALGEEGSMLYTLGARRDGREAELAVLRDLRTRVRFAGAWCDPGALEQTHEARTTRVWEGDPERAVRVEYKTARAGEGPQWKIAQGVVATSAITSQQEPAVLIAAGANIDTATLGEIVWARTRHHAEEEGEPASEHRVRCVGIAARHAKSRSAGVRSVVEEAVQSAVAHWVPADMKVRIDIAQGKVEVGVSEPGKSR